MYLASMDALVEIIKGQLENQFLTGGAALVLFTAILALLRNVPVYIRRGLLRQVITTVDIADHDPAFYWVQRWLGELPYTRDKARILTVSTKMTPDGGNVPKDPGSPNAPPISIVFSPAPGNHLIRFRGHFVLLTRERQTANTPLGGVAYHETMLFRTFSRHVVREIIYEARRAAHPPEDDRITLFKPTWTDWRAAQRRPPRSYESVIQKGSLLEDIRADLDEFFDSKQFYIDLGIPYQRGYLLSGNPGNGKTSLVVALASHFKRDIYILSLSLLGDNQLAQLISNLPEHAFLLIEDVDALFHKREPVQGREDLTFSGFINAVDGVSAPPGRIMFMTTNHVNKLDPALIRPGRIDMHYEFSNADPDMAERMFLRFFPGQHVCSQAFRQRIADSPTEFTMAALQKHLMRYRREPQTAAANLPERSPFQNGQ